MSANDFERAKPEVGLLHHCAAVANDQPGAKIFVSLNSGFVLEGSADHFFTDGLSIVTVDGERVFLPITAIASIKFKNPG